MKQALRTLCVFLVLCMNILMDGSISEVTGTETPPGNSVLLPSEERPLLMEGESAYLRGDYQKALECFLKDISMNPDEVIQGILHYNLGLVYYKKQNPLLALEHLQLSVKLLSPPSQSSYLANAFSCIGSIQYELGHYAEALDGFQQSFNLHNRLHLKKEMAKDYNDLGLVYLEMGSHDQALSCFAQSMDIHKGMGNSLGMAICTNNRGLVYLSRGQFSAALEMFTDALQKYIILEGAQD